MKKMRIILCAAIALCVTRVKAQNDSGGSPWFNKLTIGQSMATSEQQQLPAQFNVTFPKQSPASFLVNVGAGYNVASIGKNSILSVIGEYHRNTLTDSAQNNLQLGVKGYLYLGNFGNDNKRNFLIVDPQYSWDGIARKNSLETNLLFDPKWSMDPFNIGKPTQQTNRKGTFFLTIYAGTQLQQVFPSDTTQSRGFKLRPLLTGIVSYSFNRKQKMTDPLLTISVNYSQRKTIVNTTHDGEGFTHMLNAGITYFLIGQPLKVSIGASFVEGSDYFSGLKPQQYFLLSLNVSKAAK